MSSNTDNLEGYFPAEIVNEAFGNRPSTTTLMDCIFLPGRVPRDLTSKISADQGHLEQQLLAQKPLMSTSLSKPYWKKGANKREFDTVRIDVYSAVCLADDRHLLEAIVSVGGMYVDLSGLTLRQAIEIAQINVEIDRLSNQYHDLLDTKMFSGVYDYFLCDFTTLFDFLGLKNQKANKNTVMTRLQRLSQMLLILDYEKQGETLPQFHTRMKLVDNNYIPLLVLEGVKNKSSIRADTITHFIVGVHKTFTASLRQEGAISRKRFLKVYPQLTGKHAVTDFCKYLDAHKREFLHGKYLTELIKDYYANKIRVSKQHVSRHINNTMTEVVLKKEVLYRDFGLLLQEKNNNDKKKDYILLYIGDDEKEEVSQ
ncbi:hypothetical protein [Vibrio cincinnatiensis]|uniref:hypothetical protein n=1 Tax=Vibrio cincinnatiensis TaxID=675 RepID=UPI001EDCA043|nr:hypothetical protein [Vibrio cincinnatiensis]MCG3733739.1 hypothetical protein [Vibrio cincinnatiensis]MCG3740950.1 hypothetical protein [Vibrio cincinnatiensis]